MKERHQTIPAVYLILKNQDNQICLMRRFKTGYMDGFYSLPAGHLEGKESLKEALAREVNEEIGITVGLEDMQLVHVSNNLKADPERIDFFFMTKKWNGDAAICEPDKCDHILWTDQNCLPANTIPFVKSAINGEKEKQYYSEYREP